MTEPTVNLRGAVDLSALSAPPPKPGASTGAGAASGVVVDVTVQTFQEVMQRSTSVPVIVDLRSPRSPASTEVTGNLEQLAGEYGGRFLLAKVDVDANPQIAQAFGAQAVPTVCAVLQGQPLPLFQGSQPVEQIRAVIDEVLRVAAENGVDGKVEGATDEPDDAEDADEAEEEPLPAHLQAAYDAIENDDLDAAAQVLSQALKENPADAEAKAGLAQVELGRRTKGADPRQLLDAAAQAAPADVEAQLAAADVEAAAGQIGAAYARLITVVRLTAGDDRERVRERLLELFLIVPQDDPDLIKARRDLAFALY